MYNIKEYLMLNFSPYFKINSLNWIVLSFTYYTSLIYISIYIIFYGY